MRTTAAAVIVVGFALVIGAVGLVAMLRSSLTSNVRTAAALRATDVAGVLRAGTPPDGLAVSSEEDLLIQVLDARGGVVTSSPNIAGQERIAVLAAGHTARISNLPVGEAGDFLVVAAPARSPGGQAYTVLVGRALAPVDHSVRAVTGILVAGLPLLLLVVAVTTWRVVSRALAPVEAIRAEVDEISASELHRRVPDPAGRDEIARLASTMNRMLARLDEARVRQQRLVSDASHELRSPIATIRQHAEVARQHPARVGVGELAEVVLAEDLRLQRLVEDLLWLARADERTLPLHRRPTDLDDLVLVEVRRLRTTTDLHVDATAVGAGRVDGDPAQLRRLLRNLADNAARHARTTVAIQLNTETGAAVLRVDDDGTGIPHAERGRVFERFVRLDDARDRDRGGSGLGLAIVSEIATAHGGSVAVLDSPLGGARVELRLPWLDD